MSIKKYDFRIVFLLIVIVNFFLIFEQKLLKTFLRLEQQDIIYLGVVQFYKLDNTSVTHDRNDAKTFMEKLLLR